MKWISKQPLLRFTGALFALQLTVLLSCYVMFLLQPKVLESYGTAPTFALTDQRERLVKSNDVRGTIVVANTIYTTCTDICTMVSQQMQTLQDRLRKEGLLGDRVQLLSFTVDPAHDTPQVLNTYASRYGADPDAWRFLTGPENEIVPMIIEGFYVGVTVIPSTATPMNHAGMEHPEHGSYDVSHSGRIVLIDQEWQMRAFYDGFELDPDRVVADIRSLTR